MKLLVTAANQLSINKRALNQVSLTCAFIKTSISALNHTDFDTMMILIPLILLLCSNLIVSRTTNESTTESPTTFTVIGETSTPTTLMSSTATSMATSSVVTTTTGPVTTTTGASQNQINVTSGNVINRNDSVHEKFDYRRNESLFFISLLSISLFFLMIVNFVLLIKYASTNKHSS